MTPQISGAGVSDVQEYREPSLTYRQNTETVAGKVDGLESVRQAVQHILLTERYSNPIYDDDYGVELEQYIGKDIGFIEAGIEATLREALTQDDRITDISVESVQKSDKQTGACTVKFTVYSIFGNFEEEKDVLQ